ncbi:MAG: PAS domain-containing protein, partial [Lachnospiraceae bacterium]|nr:PAS domain-containing protein [Lachnospiraceae bacterium]
MGFSSAEEALWTLVDAYYDKREVEAVLSCVTEDIQWVGTENDDSAKGKEALRELLEADVAAFPDSFSVDLGAPNAQLLGNDAVVFTVVGKQKEVPGIVCGFSVRGTACCVKTANGWLISNVHTSVPNSAMEKYSLEKELDENKRLERALMSSIPGGVAIYRAKTDGRVETDYVSESLAAMCGYTAPEFLALLKYNSLCNLVPEDIPIIQNAFAEGLESNQPVSVRYRIYTRDKEELLIRLDANRIESEPLREDDIAVYSAVHTLVSQEVINIMANEKHLQQLVDLVPVGIGIYDIIGDEVNLTYLNDAYYKMLGFQRNTRIQYLGRNNTNVVHPDDRDAVFGMIAKLIAGADNGLVQHRIQNSSDEWVWINLSASVIERNGSRLKVYVAFTDCDELMKSQQAVADAQFRLKAILDNIPGGVAIYRVKKDGTIPTDYVSDGLARICGYDDSADIMKVINPDFGKLVLEEDFPKVAAACQNSLLTGEPTHVMYRVHGKSGNLIWITLDSVIMKNAELGEDDAAVFYAVQAPVSEDTLLAQAEQDYYRSILNNTKTAYFELDGKGNFYSSDTFSNYKLSEFGSEGIYGGVNTIKCIHPDDFEKIREYLLKHSTTKDGSS